MPFSFPFARYPGVVFGRQVVTVEVASVETLITQVTGQVKVALALFTVPLQATTIEEHFVAVPACHQPTIHCGGTAVGIQA